MTFAIAFLAGIASWSLLEYVIHRWLGHERRFVRRTMFGREHTRHHSQGDYFASAWFKLVAAVVVLVLVGVPAIALAGVEAGSAYALGLVGFYTYYEWFHLSLHVREGVGTHGRWARRHHFHHHFGDPRRNFGVTSPIWDHVFGTYAAVTQVFVPEKLAMRWLRDPSSGAFRAELAPTWVVRTRGGAS